MTGSRPRRAVYRMMCIDTLLSDLDLQVMRLLTGPKPNHSAAVQAVRCAIIEVLGIMQEAEDCLYEGRRTGIVEQIRSAEKGKRGKTRVL